jgi:hypothetical protein
MIMNQLFNGSICVSDIPKEKLTQAKNGKLYLNIDIWINENVDQYGNIGSVSVRQSKEQREAKERKTYIGNFKKSELRQPDAPAQVEIDSLPF